MGAGGFSGCLEHGLISLAGPFALAVGNGLSYSVNAFLIQSTLAFGSLPVVMAITSKRAG